MSTISKIPRHRRGNFSVFDPRAYLIDPDHLSPRLREYLDLVPERALDYTWTKRPDWLPAEVRERVLVKS